MLGGYNTWWIWGLVGLGRLVKGYDPTDSLMDGDQAQSGVSIRPLRFDISRLDTNSEQYLPNHLIDPAIIQGGSFGQIWAYRTPGLYNQNEQFYAKPLVYTPANGGGRQLVLAFSEQNRMYVLDAANGTLVASRDLTSEGEVPFMVSDLGSCNDISGTVGITGTPVIDPGTDTVYFWAKTYNAKGATGFQNGAYRFHAVDAESLEERPGFPTSIEGLPADNDGNRYFTGGTILQRTSLNLVNGHIISGFGGHCDQYNYTGWAVSMDKVGKPVSILTTYGGAQAQPPSGSWANGGGGIGIWMSGAAMASDGNGRVFFATGNAGMPTVNGNTPASGRLHLDTLSEAIVNLAVSSAGVLTLQDYFEPSDYHGLDAGDKDLGAGGVTLWNLTQPVGGISNLAITCGKNGICYIANADNLGGYRMGASNGDAVLQTITPPAGGAIFGNVGVYPNEGGYLYITPVGSPTYAYKLGQDDSGRITFSLAGQTDDSSAGRVGAGPPTITTNGGGAAGDGTAILWVADPDAGVRAYMAVPSNGKLQKIELPAMPMIPKFQRLAFGNGRYYTTTVNNGIVGYGAPVTFPLNCSSPVDFGSVPIGQTITHTVSCTALIQTSIQDMTIGNSLYTASNASLPRGQLQPGNSFSFPVTFDLANFGRSVGSTSSPFAQPGVQTTALMLHTQNAQAGYTAIQPIALRGSAVSANAYVSITPPTVAFSSVVLGQPLQESFSIQNLGQAPMTILGYSFSSSVDSTSFSNLTQTNGNWNLDKNDYYTTADLPGVNTRIAAGGNIDVHVTFTPSVIGSFFTVLQVWTTGGMQDLLLTGQGSTAPLAKLEYSTNEGGWLTISNCGFGNTCYPQVDIGNLISAPTIAPINVTLRITNNGGSQLTVTKSKPPLGIVKAANAAVDLHEGLTIPPGQSSSAVIYFAPQSAPVNIQPVEYSATWTLNTNDRSFGLEVVNLTGTLSSQQVGPLLPNSGGQAQFRYLGCYQDATNSRIEPNSWSDNTGMTNGECLNSLAAKGGAVFAGTQYTKECWYGNMVPAPAHQVTDTNCQGYVCVGDSSQYCGGSGGYMPVYYDVTKYNAASGQLINGAGGGGGTEPDNNNNNNGQNGGNNGGGGFLNPATVGQYNYMGCYHDVTANRTLKDKFDGGSKTQNVEQCVTYCQGFKYSGSEYAGECFCAQVLPPWATRGKESECNMACAGNAKEACGGAGRLSLYGIVPKQAIDEGNRPSNSTIPGNGADDDDDD